jgi:hypothetical protein
MGQDCQMVYFHTKNSNLEKIWRALEWKNVRILYDHLEYFTAIRYNLLPFGIVYGHLVYFSRFGMFGARKIWQPWIGEEIWIRKINKGTGKTFFFSCLSGKQKSKSFETATKMKNCPHWKAQLMATARVTRFFLGTSYQNW